MAYFKGTRRQKGETMSDYVTRKAEAYTRAQQSMARYQHENPGASVGTQSSGVSRLGARRSPSPMSSSRSSAGMRVGGTPNARGVDCQTSEVLRNQGSLGEPAVVEEPEDQGGNAEELMAWNEHGWTQDWHQWWHRWGGYLWSGDSWGSPWKPAGPTDSTEWGRDVLPEILPAFVQGWFLFVDSGLDTLERNVLHAELKGDFDVRSVEAALRKHWADADLRRRDQEKGRHMANLADDEDFLAGERNKAGETPSQLSGGGSHLYLLRLAGLGRGPGSRGLRVPHHS